MASLAALAITKRLADASPYERRLIQAWQRGASTRAEARGHVSRETEATRSRVRRVAHVIAASPRSDRYSKHAAAAISRQHGRGATAYVRKVDTVFDHARSILPHHMNPRQVFYGVRAMTAKQLEDSLKMNRQQWASRASRKVREGSISPWWYK